MNLYHFSYFLLLLANLGLAQQEEGSSKIVSKKSAAMTLEEASTKLEIAYKKEFSFLESERRSLMNRINEVNRKLEAQKIKGNKTIAQRQREAVALKIDIDALTGRLEKLETTLSSQDQLTDTMSTVAFQASETLKPIGFQSPPTLEDNEDLRLLFKTGIQALEKSNKIRTETGSFFLANGAKVEGEITYIGRIAAFGRSQHHAGALVPKGEALLKIYDSKRKPISHLAEQTQQKIKRLFLFESLSKPWHEKQEKSFTDTLQAGGLIGYVILTLGCVAALLLVVRGLLVSKATKKVPEFMIAVTTQVEQGNAGDVLSQIEQNAHNGPIQRIAAVTLRNLQKPKQHLEDIISEHILRESIYLDRFGTIILVTAAVAPLLGLLGTVTGMIGTFDMITEFGTGDPKMLSGGISEALVTTMFGLIVAIPTLFLGHIINSKAEHLKDTMEKVSLELMNAFQADKVRSDA